MFLTRFGREIAIRLKSGLSTSESLDIWKLLESAVSINRNLYMLDNSELGKLKNVRRARGRRSIFRPGISG